MVTTIFMPLSQEGTDVWRPVTVTPLEGAEYRIEGPMPDDEVWQFAPGTLIQVRWKKFADGQHRLVPKGPAPAVASAIAGYYRCVAGIFFGVMPLLLMIEWLPRRPDGRLTTLPLVPATLVWIALAAVVIVWWKPNTSILFWAAWSAMAFGLLAILVTLSIP